MMAKNSLTDADAKVVEVAFAAAILKLEETERFPNVEPIMARPVLRRRCQARKAAAQDQPSLESRAIGP